MSRTRYSRELSSELLQHVSLHLDGVRDGVKAVVLEELAKELGKAAIALKAKCIDDQNWHPVNIGITRSRERQTPWAPSSRYAEDLAKECRGFLSTCYVTEEGKFAVMFNGKPVAIGRAYGRRNGNRIEKKFMIQSPNGNISTERYGLERAADWIKSQKHKSTT